MKFSDLPEIQIEVAKREATVMTEDWLRSRGWNLTSNTPGSYWMWIKEWDGKVFMVDTNVAARIQGLWDREEHFRKHPEDIGE